MTWRLAVSTVRIRSGDIGRGRADVLDAGLAVISAGLIVGTVAAFVWPALRTSVYAMGLDTLLDTIATLVTIAVAVLMSTRFRERGEPVALVLAGAFVVLAIANAVAVLLVIAHIDDGPVAAGLPSGQGPAYVSAMAQLLAASLVVVGLWAALRGATANYPWIVVVAPAAGLLMVILLIVRFNPELAPLSAPYVPPDLQGSTASQLVPVSTPLGWLLGAACAVLFFLGAVMSRRLYRHTSSISDAYLAVGLVFAGFAQIHLALSPEVYSGLISGGSLLRVGFDIALLLGIQAEVSATISSLRQANQDLARLKDAEADRAALEERARLARELHDGLSQDLWLAKLKVGRLSSLSAPGSEAAELAGEIGGAIDAGLADARQAVIALRWTGDGETSFDQQLASYVDDFADRSGLQAEFVGDQPLRRMNPRAEAELLRIAQEALNNVRRHADATVVRVSTTTGAGSLRLGVVDNGRGFDPASAGDSAFGLLSMRERAGLIGGLLTIESRPHDGTRVWVDVPLACIAAAPSPVPS